MGSSHTEPHFLFSFLEVGDEKETGEDSERLESGEKPERLGRP